jgi:hypothetical protein
VPVTLRGEDMGMNGLCRVSNAAVVINEEKKHSWVLVAHSCNPSYSGDRDQED